MGFFDFICDDVLSPIGDALVSTVETVGEGLGYVADGAVDLLEKGVDTIKENPLETAVIIGSALLTGGAGGGASVLLKGSLLSSASRVIATNTLRAVATKTVATAVLGNVTESLVDNFLRKTVSPVPGSVVYCDLLAVEHSGIYVGGGQIIHLDGSGHIEIVDADAFINRLGGFNTAISIYVSCTDESPAGSEAVAQRARAVLGKQRSYNLLLNNCHQFASGCLSGNFDNADNFLAFLKTSAKERLGANSWRVWER